ncbi:hypothetical protein LFX25_06770 [Leptospira sp. FAT2]|uniref:hypothetical protein n=1 Tax=Leptospira sanjuanensis TaxID=2879643 RepID=UPI001EE82C35|nr:hypothetical protein [Leptospira sanjuanensis]MCG6192942.1 hypothetical protein [Leptospira sanjuanensis]
MSGRGKISQKLPTQFDSSKAKLVAAKLLPLIFVLVTFFHILVLAGAIPFTKEAVDFYRATGAGDGREEVVHFSNENRS